MKFRIVRHSIVAVSVAVSAVACDKSSPTSPSQGGGGTTVSSIAITGDLTLSEGQTSQLTATATMSDGSKEIITSQAQWTSANQAVVTVSSTGLATAIGDVIPRVGAQHDKVGQFSGFDRAKTIADTKGPRAVERGDRQYLASGNSGGLKPLQLDVQ